MAVTAVGARDPPRQPVAQDVGDRAGHEVEEDHVGRGQIGRGAHPHTGLDPAAELRELRRERVADGPGTARGHGPAVPVTRGDDRQADRCAGRPVERAEGVRGHAGEERAGGPRPPQPGHRGGGQQGLRPEGRQAQRMTRHVCERPHEVLGQRVVAVRERPEHPPPPSSVHTAEAVGRLLHRPVQDPGLAGVQRMHAVDVRQAPGEPVSAEVEAPQEGRADRHGVGGGAVVVQEARGQFTGAGAAADRVGGLQDGDLDALPGQEHGGCETVRTAAHHDGRSHTSPASPRRWAPVRRFTGSRSGEGGGRENGGTVERALEGPGPGRFTTLRDVRRPSRRLWLFDLRGGPSRRDSQNCLIHAPDRPVPQY